MNKVGWGADGNASHLMLYSVRWSGNGLCGAIKSLGESHLDSRGRVCTMSTSREEASAQLGRSELIVDGRRWTLGVSD